MSAQTLLYNVLTLASKCTIVWRPARTTSNSDCPGLTFAGRFPKLETTSRASLVRAEFLERQGRIDHLATQNVQNVTRSNSASVAVVDCLISSQICQICMSWLYTYATWAVSAQLLRHFGDIAHLWSPARGELWTRVQQWLWLWEQVLFGLT